MKIAIKNNQTVKIYSGQCNFQQLIIFIKKQFNLNISSYSLTYLDQDNDQISLATNQDMITAYDLNSNKKLLKVKITLQNSQETEKNFFEVLQQKPTKENISLQDTANKEPKIEESTQKNDKKWRCWGRKNHHDSHHSSTEKHHFKHGGFGKFHHMINNMIAEKVDQRVKILLPCLKAQIQEPSFIKTFSVTKDIVHQGSTCKSCFATPIVGIRYKCFRCPNFDLCENCQNVVDHEHNLLKMKKPFQFGANNCDFSAKFFKKFWKCHKGERQSSSSCEKSHQLKATRKLVKIFGGQPEKYRKFVEQNKSLKKFEILEKYAKENNLLQHLITFRCQKIGKRMNKQPSLFRKIVEENIQLKPRQIIRKLIENGQQFSSFNFKKESCQKRQKTKSFGKKQQISQGTCERKCSKTAWEGKDTKRRHRDEQNTHNNVNNQKGKILQAMIDLFGPKNVKNYLNFIESHFSIGQEEIINKWLELNSAHSPSA